MNNHELIQLRKSIFTKVKTEVLMNGLDSRGEGKSLMYSMVDKGTQCDPVIVIPQENNRSGQDTFQPDSQRPIIVNINIFQNNSKDNEVISREQNIHEAYVYNADKTKMNTNSNVFIEQKKLSNLFFLETDMKEKQGRKITQEQQQNNLKFTDKTKTKRRILNCFCKRFHSQVVRSLRRNKDINKIRRLRRLWKGEIQIRSNIFKSRMLNLYKSTGEMVQEEREDLSGKNVKDSV